MSERSESKDLYPRSAERCSAKSMRSRRAMPGATGMDADRRALHEAPLRRGRTARRGMAGDQRSPLRRGRGVCADLAGDQRSPLRRGRGVGADRRGTGTPRRARCPHRAADHVCVDRRALHEAPLRRGRDVGADRRGTGTPRRARCPHRAADHACVGQERATKGRPYGADGAPARIGMTAVGDGGGTGMPPAAGTSSAPFGGTFPVRGEGSRAVGVGGRPKIALTGEDGRQGAGSAAVVPGEGVQQPEAGFAVIFLRKAVILEDASFQG